jgi:hypothetical protein
MMYSSELKAWESGGNGFLERNARLAIQELSKPLEVGEAHLEKGGGCTQRRLRPEKSIEHGDRW